MDTMDSVLSTSWSSEHVVIEKIDVSEWENGNKFCIVLHNILTAKECQHLIDFSESKAYEPALVNVGGGRQKLMSDYRNNDRFIHDDPVTMELIWQRVLKATNDHDQESHNTLLNIPFINDRMAKRGNHKVYHAVGLNERMRFLRYDPGTFFASHYDGSYMRSNEAGIERKGEQSFVTFQLYLNEGFQGGSTRFLSINDTTNHDEDVENETATVTSTIWSNFLTPTKRRSSSRPHYNVIPHTGSVLLFQHDCCHEGAKLYKGRKYAIRSDVMYSDRDIGNEYSNQPVILNTFLF